MAGKNKIKMVLVTRKGCVHCSQTKEIIKKIQPEYPELTVSEVDIITPKGQELVGKYSIMSSPGIIINGKLFSMGGSTEKELRKKLDEIKNG